MDVTDYEFKVRKGMPPDDRKGGYVFGFDADNQPYIMKWRRGEHPCWLATTLDDAEHYGSAAPIVHALVANNADKIVSWADAPLRWSALDQPADAASSSQKPYDAEDSR